MAFLVESQLSMALLMMIKKDNFLKELHDLYSDRESPSITGGDFNIVRGPEDKSNGVVDFNWCDKFNSWIDECGILELHVLGRKFTWANNQDNLVMSLIDKMFVSTEFEQKFPLATFTALPKNPSDDTPIIWDSGENVNLPKPIFRFEKWWLHHPKFSKICEDIWRDSEIGDKVIDIWQNKIRKLRKKLRRWSINIEATNRKNESASEGI